MIVVTGGAGFIGSALVWGLNRRGEDAIVIVDRLDQSDKWKNLVPLRYSDYIDKDDFVGMLEGGAFGNRITAIFHLGACSSTTERDARYLMENNYRYTLRLARWCETRHRCRFIYASSAATYGGGEQGFVDNEEQLSWLRPLNRYGYSKHLFDLCARKNGWFTKIVGLKYFNVFGPNEYHKGDMRSVIAKKYDEMCTQGRISLFQSYHHSIGDGEQKRDFIYIKDAVAMTLFFYDRPEKNGLYNIGSGVAHTWNEVADAMVKAAGKNISIDYIPMPEAVREAYQYYTCADIRKLRDAGCEHVCAGLNESVKDYMSNYLARGRHLSEA